VPALVALFGIQLLASASRAESPFMRPGSATTAPAETTPNEPALIQSDGALSLQFGREHVILPGGLQPYFICTTRGTLLLQGQLRLKPVEGKRIAYPAKIATVISRDGGASWADVPLKPGENGPYIEGGTFQFKDGTAIIFDTYVTPGDSPGVGIGQMYKSTDDLKTFEGPIDVKFNLPTIRFKGLKDDGGRPHEAARLHRSMIALPGGDLLTTVYGTGEGDVTPVPYQPTMVKGRVWVVRSSDQGLNWSTTGEFIAPPDLGTEGLGEPVLCRVNQGPQAGRLICLMRTGRNLRKVTSDDDGKTWTPIEKQIFADLDINRTELWVDQFRKYNGANKKPLDEHNLDELRGAVVDPDLIQLRSGLLVAAFGVRVPQKFCWTHPEHPWNGNYLAFSRDGGDTWSNVARVTSGVQTTHYMAIKETPTDNEIYVTYDLGAWSGKPRRDIVGRTLKVTKNEN
jgi:hypothetical protein